MFECDGPEFCEIAIISFSFELGHTRSPAARLTNGWRNPGCGLAFRASKCDTGESPDRVHNVPPKRAEIGRIRAFIRQLESETASGWCGSRTALRSADRHHNETSWTMSWASAALPRMRCSKAGPVSDPTSVVWAFARLGRIPKI